MDNINLLQCQYRDQLIQIISMKCSKRIKTRMIEGLIGSLKQLETIHKSHQIVKTKMNEEVLSTSISQCRSNSCLMENEIEQLEEKIIKLRMVKFQNNEDIETLEEQLYQIQKIVKARCEYNDYLKKNMDSKMEFIQNNSAQKEKQKDKSYLNKSLDTVAGLLKISKWWA